MKNPIFIAEVKSKSPNGFSSYYSNQQLLETAIEFGDWISIHTDPRFGGSFDDIYLARKQTKKPILGKGFHCHDDDVKKAFDLGANYVLVVDRPSYKLLGKYYNQILFEFSSIKGLENVSYDFLQYSLIVYNGRDLKTGIGKKYIGDYAEFRKKCSWLCGASLLKSPTEVQMFYPNCDAFIVGSNLDEFCREIKYKKLLEEEKKCKLS